MLVWFGMTGCAPSTARLNEKPASVGAANTSPTQQTTTAPLGTSVSKTTTKQTNLITKQPKPKPCIDLPVSNPAYSTLNWANIFRFNGIFYFSDYDNTGRVSVGRVISNDDLGPEFAKVKCNLNERVLYTDEYQSTDGDATYLTTGTPVYTVKGYKPQFRLAAYLNP